MTYQGETKNYETKGGSVRSSDVLVNERIIIDLQGKDKYEVLEKLVKMAKASGKVSDEANLFKKAIEREKIRSTGIGGGIGKITHG